MTSASEEFLNEVASLLGDSGLIRDQDVMAPWLSDWRGRYHGNACALALPASTQEVSGLVRLCSRHNVPIVPQGGNSGMSGGATPDKSGTALLLSTRRMNAIRSIDIASGTAECEAGTVLQSLQEAAEAQGMRFALTLGGKGSATVGGLISTNAGGTQVLRHGTMRAQVLGLEAVLPDGSVFSSMNALRKDNRGWDLKQLFIGSEGTLGIITAAVLRLVPGGAQRMVAWAGVQTIQQARQLLIHCDRLAGGLLEGFEVLPQSSLEAVLNYLPDARSPLAAPHGWHVLIELVGDGVVPLGERVLEDALERGLLADCVIAASESQAEAFWALRDSVSPAERAKGPAMQHDIAVPVARMADFIDTAIPALEGKFPGTRAFGFGHLGDGNIHFHVQAPPGVERDAWEASEGKLISATVDDLVTAWQGTISAEHGIGQLKVDELQRLADPVALLLLRKVKEAIDPVGLMNPGKLLARKGPSA